MLEYTGGYRGTLRDTEGYWVILADYYQEVEKIQEVQNDRKVKMSGRL